MGVLWDIKLRLRNCSQALSEYKGVFEIGPQEFIFSHTLLQKSLQVLVCDSPEDHQKIISVSLKSAGSFALAGGCHFFCDFLDLHGITPFMQERFISITKSSSLYEHIRFFPWRQSMIPWYFQWKTHRTFNAMSRKSVISSIAYFKPSLPNPDIFTPP